MIIDPAFHSRYADQMKEIITESKGAIILSGKQHATTEGVADSITEHFYNDLRQAEFYKIPDNFFSLLGHDRTVFNYLRKVFQKSIN